MPATSHTATLTLTELEDHIGHPQRPTPWLELTQGMVTAFGGVTLDFDPHHIDPEQAQNGPFGKAAAHGFLMLSLISHFGQQSPLQVQYSQHINYGLNKARFIKPALVGDHFRAQLTLTNVTERQPGYFLLTNEVKIMSRQTEEDVLFAEWLTMLIA